MIKNTNCWGDLSDISVKPATLVLLCCCRVHVPYSGSPALSFIYLFISCLPVQHGLSPCRYGVIIFYTNRYLGLRRPRCRLPIRRGTVKGALVKAALDFVLTV